MSLLVPLLLVFGQLQPLVIPGERLIYEVSSARFGKMGFAQFSVTTMESGALRLAFDFEARVLLFKVSDHTYAELDGETLQTLRYVKRERSPIGKHDEDVVIDPVSSTWTRDGKAQLLACPNALDELSFIYLIRNLELAPGEERILTRHFDAARNPVRVKRVTSDSAAATIIEMRVPDKRQKSGFSLLRFHISNDERRLPLRIESSMPVAGRVTMTLVPGA